MVTSKNIFDLAPLLAYYFFYSENTDFNMIDYSQFLERGKTKLGGLKKYLINKLHDSRILDFSLQDDQLSITLNDFSVNVFARAISDKFGLSIDPYSLLFSLRIVFRGNLSVDFYSVNDKGDLNKTEPVDVDEYLGEQVLSISEDAIDVAFHLWKSNIKQNIPGESIIVIVSSKSLEVVEDQDNAWSQVFDDSFNDLYNYFKVNFESERYVSDYSKCNELIEEFKKKELKR